MNLIQKSFDFNSLNLFEFILNALELALDYLDVKTETVISSSINIDHNLKSEEKVIAICKYFDAKTYINPIGGTELYNKETFLKNGFNLQFLKANNCIYTQLKNEFVPFLSIIDVLMFNSKEETKRIIEKEFVLV
jgi:hypothetical protein